MKVNFQSQNIKPYSYTNLYKNNTRKQFINKVSNSSSDCITFSGNLPVSLKVGTYIKNVGLIIKEQNVLNKETNLLEKCYLMHQGTSENGVIRLVKSDAAKIKKLSSIFTSNPKLMEDFKKHKFYTYDSTLDDLSVYNPEIKGLFDDLRISEIGYTRIKNPKAKQMIFNKGYKSISDSGDLVFIEDLFTKQNQYAIKSRLVGFPLIKALQNNGDKNILTIALALGKNDSSPVNLYLRLGFKPLKDSVQDIDTHKIRTYKGERLDPKYKVSMYLPEDAVLYDIIKKDSSLDEIYSVKPDWFKKITNE